MKGIQTKLYSFIMPFLDLKDIDPWSYFDTDSPHHNTYAEGYARGLYSWLFVICLAGVMVSLAVLITSYTVSKSSKKRAEALSGIMRVCRITFLIFGFVEILNVLWFILHSVT